MSTYSLDTDIVTKLLKKHPGNRQIVHVIVTGNVDHFREVGLRVENWGGTSTV